MKPYTSHPSAQHQPTHRSGFTLIELLVVITIIVVLAALGFMGGSRMLQSSREATAISNLRDISGGLFTIQSDGGALAAYKLPGSYPAESGFTGTGKRYTWAYEVAELLGYGKYNKDGWGAKFEWTTPLDKTPFHDPTADWELKDNGDPSSRSNDSMHMTGQFSYNIQLGAYVNPWVPTFERGKGGYDSDVEGLLSQTTDPSILIYVGQCAGTGKLSKIESSLPGHVATSAASIRPWRALGSPGTRIRGGAYVIFADGHGGWINTGKLYGGPWNSPNLSHDGPMKNRRDVN